MDSVLETEATETLDLAPELETRMETAKLKKFAQQARRSLIEQVQAKLKHVLAENSPARRENKQAVDELEKQIKQTSEERVVDKVAYTWFNRFCALRFMDVNRYTRIGIVSPAEGQIQPEILAEAKMGHIPAEIVSEEIQGKVFSLITGKAPSPDPQAEAYRLLLVAACNFYHRVMPYLFEKIADYTELLMPDDLLSGNSVLAQTRDSMTLEVCKDVEVIGWLYQFYISEKKQEVFDGLKKNKKLTPENIPAATQLFTPRWVVQYLVENSLGRLWMLNRPNSQLLNRMPYYIRPEQAETDFIPLASPEEIKVCDPACGSGHMLVYAFELLHAIYEEEGYDSVEIPAKILLNNLYGIEIDERAAELAALALTMKAREKYKRFLEKPIQPNICALEPIKIDQGELDKYMDLVGRDLFTRQLEETLYQFEDADNFGSLIQPKVSKVSDVMALLEEKKAGSQLFLYDTNQLVLKALKQADYLGQKYQVVIANPPYMGWKGMSQFYSEWVKSNYPNSKSDTFAMFIERGLELIQSSGYCAMVTMESWMFLSSYEKLRYKLLAQTSLQSLVHMPYLGKGGTSMGINFGTSASVFYKNDIPNLSTKFICVRYYETNENGTPKEFPVRNERLTEINTKQFEKIPGAPIAYWISQNTLEMFDEESCGKMIPSYQGMATTDNSQFLRLHWEVSSDNRALGYTRSDAQESGRKWFPYNKGGSLRKWYGNHEYFVNWKNEGQEIKSSANKKYPYLKGNISYVVKEQNPYFEECISWTDLTSKGLSARFYPKGFLFDVSGHSAFGRQHEQNFIILCYLNSKIGDYFAKILNSSFHFQVGDFRKLPYPSKVATNKICEIANRCIQIAEYDWNQYETSWNFKFHPLIDPNYKSSTIDTTYSCLREYYNNLVLEMHKLEEENNKEFIEAYNLQEQFTPTTSVSEITLFCNPHNKYGGDKDKNELEVLFLADTIRDFISYAVGCMFGRFALEKPGLILAHQGETLVDYLKQIPNPSFQADADNVIPILDGDWFTDDITIRFHKFLKVTFGEENFQENLEFIEKAIGKDIRKYFLKDFYTDHVKRYKKRPIYWLFSSPKGSFNSLIYMHRYRPDTVSVVLNDYLREFRTKLAARVDHLVHVSGSSNASQAEKTSALKEIENLKKVIAEINEYEQTVLYPLATQQLEIDLDDGVKVNYLKFGDALKKIPGLEAKED